MSLVYDRWLRRASPRIAIVYCWYDPVSFALLLAARRLGVATVDLQHGRQSDHYAYWGWTKGPAAGYEAVPDFFWTWGNDQADHILAKSPAFRTRSQTIVGGFPWLNRCRSGGAPELCRDRKAAEALCNGFDTVVLVTLQKDIDNCAIIAKAIQAGPARWRWLIRLHPGSHQQEKHAIRHLLGSLQHPGVDLDQASTLALYSLLPQTDVHLTSHSTCVLEALGFGVPSVLLGPDGASAYSRFIHQGVAFAADAPQAMLRKIEKAKSVDPERCRDAVSDLFAPEPSARRNIDALLAAVGVHD